MTDTTNTDDASGDTFDVDPNSEAVGVDITSGDGNDPDDGDTEPAQPDPVEPDPDPVEPDDDPGPE